MSDINALLIAWAEWSHDSDNLGYPTPSLNIQKHAPVADSSDLRQARYDCVTMTDCEALRIDKAVGELAKSCVVQYNVLKLHYQHNVSDSRIAREYLKKVLSDSKGHHSEVKPKLFAAVGFVQGYLAANA